MSGGVEGVKGALRAGREQRYSGAGRGIGGIRVHWGAPRECRRHQGAIKGALEGVQVSGHIGVLGVHWGLAESVGTQGPEGYIWHKEALGAPRG